jgi:hypothetical protein
MTLACAYHPPSPQPPVAPSPVSLLESCRLHPLGLSGGSPAGQGPRERRTHAPRSPATHLGRGLSPPRRAPTPLTNAPRKEALAPLSASSARRRPRDGAVLLSLRHVVADHGIGPSSPCVAPKPAMGRALPSLVRHTAASSAKKGPLRLRHLAGTGTPSGIDSPRGIGAVANSPP